MTTVWKSKEASQLAALVEIAFKNGAIKQDTYDAGYRLALHINMTAMNKGNEPALRITRQGEDEARAAFDALMQRDTGAGLPPPETGSDP